MIVYFVMCFTMHSFHDMPATRASRVRLPRNNISHQLSQWVSRSVMFLDLSSYQLGSCITSCGIINQFWDLSNRFFGHFGTFGASFGRLCAKISNDPNLNLFHNAPKNGPKSHFGLLEQSNLFLGALCQNWGWPKSQNWFKMSGWDVLRIDPIMNHAKPTISAHQTSQTSVFGHFWPPLG